MSIAAWFSVENVLVFFHFSPTLSPLWHIINTYIPTLSSMYILFVYVCGRGSCLTAHLLVSRYVKRLKNHFQNPRQKIAGDTKLDDLYQCYSKLLVSELFVTDLQQDEDLVLKCKSIMSLSTQFSSVHILLLVRLSQWRKQGVDSHSHTSSLSCSGLV